MDVSFKSIPDELKVGMKDFKRLKDRSVDKDDVLEHWIFENGKWKDITKITQTQYEVKKLDKQVKKAEANIAKENASLLKRKRTVFCNNCEHHSEDKFGEFCAYQEPLPIFTAKQFCHLLQEIQ